MPHSSESIQTDPDWGNFLFGPTDTGVPHLAISYPARVLWIPPQALEDQPSAHQGMSFHSRWSHVTLSGNTNAVYLTHEACLQAQRGTSHGRSWMTTCAWFAHALSMTALRSSCDQPAWASSLVRPVSLSADQHDCSKQVLPAADWPSDKVAEARNAQAAQVPWAQCLGH